MDVSSVASVIGYGLGIIAVAAGAVAVLRSGWRKDRTGVFTDALAAQNATIDALRERARLLELQLTSQQNVIEELRTIVHRLEGRVEERGRVLLELVSAVADAAVCESAPQCANYVSPGARLLAFEDNR